MVENDLSSLNRKLEELEHRLTSQEYNLSSLGTLSSSKKLKANELQIERVYAAKLAEEVANGSKSPERRATVAAEIEALKLCFSTWIALIDRGFKASQ